MSSLFAATVVVEKVQVRIRMVVRNLEGCSLQSVVCKSEQGVIAERGIAFISHLSNPFNPRSDPSEDDAWTSNSISQVFCSYLCIYSDVASVEEMKSSCSISFRFYATRPKYA